MAQNSKCKQTNFRLAFSIPAGKTAKLICLIFGPNAVKNTPHLLALEARPGQQVERRLIKGAVIRFLLPKAASGPTSFTSWCSGADRNFPEPCNL